MSDEHEKYFEYRYHAYVREATQSFRRVQGNIAPPGSIGAYSNPLYGPLQVVDEPTVEIRMPRESYYKICKQLYELNSEEQLRVNDPQLFDLWMQYQLWLNLKK